MTRAGVGMHVYIGVVIAGDRRDEFRGPEMTQPLRGAQIFFR